MPTTNEFSMACSKMGTDEAHVLYKGTICQSGALALAQQFEQLFGYYQYRRVLLSIESPGGEIDALEYLLRAMDKWSKQGRAVAVGTSFLCASAAAFLLSMGQWGERRVDRSTLLLFHSARIDSSSLAGMTAAFSTNLSQVLNTVDRKLLDVMMNKMLFETGSAQALVDLVLARVRYIDTHWKQLASDLTTLTTATDGNRKPDWLKVLQKWARPGADAQKFVLEMKKHLNLRLQRDVRMDLCEAYVLCLIDEIAGVVDADSIELDSPKAVIVDALLPIDMHEAGGQKQAAYDHAECAMS